MNQWIADVDKKVNKKVDKNSPPLLEIKNLSVSFNSIDEQVNVVNQVNFSLYPEQTLALVGESGSGKSVSAMSILQLHDPQKVNYYSSDPQLACQILYNHKATDNKSASQQDLLQLSDKAMQKIRGKKIAMIFQEPMTSLNPTFTIGNQLIESLQLHEGLSFNEAKKRAIELLELTGIDQAEHRYNAYPHMLSGGQRQRVMIAMALSCQPDLLIADEPTTALDVTVQLQILLLLEKLKKEFSMSMLLITHNLNLVKRFANHVCVMQNGQIVENNSSELLFNHPQHAYTKKLLDSEPLCLLEDNEHQQLLNNPVLFKGENIRCSFSAKKSFFSRHKNTIKAVDDVSCQLRSGETLGIVGESGSGKSTLGRCLLKLQDCDGNIYFNQQRIDQLNFNQLKPLRKEFQMVFQDPYSSLSPRMNIEQIIGEGLGIHFPELTKEQCKERIINILNEVGLEENMLWRYPHEFSGGQRQRIAIARVLILEPKVILLDEPTSALDVSVQKQVLDLLRKLQKKYGIAYLFITHDLKVIKSIAHLLLVMKDGKIIESGETQQLFTEPQQAYTKKLLSASLFE